ncbi:subtilisin-like protein [Aulographum hederae CBS 113979]|uniref:Subtilisin-like protein n=1 Tax=Aulographum hederae CBS 113979 TaxID=1176131 RepID=A0A6G1GLQ7_9PEZI|nr:subtilisin-like protein [Aulographum hederae CBS 113979]
MKDYKNHGTGVGSVAGGLRYGVASKTNLCLIKISNWAKNPHNPDNDNYLKRATTAGALLNGIEHAFDHIAKRRASGDRGYSIFSMSFNLENDRPHRKILEDRLKDAWAEDIVTVTTAGNDGIDAARLTFLHHTTPQSYGTADNGLITVGGLRRDGSLWPHTTPDDHVLTGSMTLYAQAEDVVRADADSLRGSVTESGTSFAAPAVAGLAAYFLSLPSLQGKFRPGSVSTDVKKYLVQHAYQRVLPGRDNIIHDPEKAQAIARYTIPETIPCAYNLVYQELCQAHAGPAKRSLDNESAVLHQRRDEREYVSESLIMESGTIVATPYTEYAVCGTTSLCAD